MEFLLLLLIILIVVAHYYPYAALVFGSFIFMLLFGGGLAIGILVGSFGGGKAPATIGHETFYTAIFLALIIATLPYIFAHLVAFYPHYRFVVITIVTVLTLVISWGGLSYGYQWEVSDVISKSCPTCTEFRSSQDTTVNGFRYAYNRDTPLTQCIVWGDSVATTQCLYFSDNCYVPIWSMGSSAPLQCSYPSVGGSIGLISVALAMLSMGLTFWYTSEIEEDTVIEETWGNEPI